MKRLVSLIGISMMLITVFVPTATVLAKNPSPVVVPAPTKLNVNGQFVDYTYEVISRNNQVCVPARALSALQLQIKWEPKNKQLTLTKGNSTLNISANQQGAFIGADGKFYMPVRALSALPGVTVQFESWRNIVFVTDESYPSNQTTIDQGSLLDARRAVLSLPLQAKGFQPWSGTMLSEHGYTFKKGEALRYAFTSYLKSAPFYFILTFVEVQNGKAYIVSQEETHPWDYEGVIKSQGDSNIRAAFNNFVYDFSFFQIIETARVKKSIYGKPSPSGSWPERAISNYAQLIYDIPGEVRTDKALAN